MEQGKNETIEKIRSKVEGYEKQGYETFGVHVERDGNSGFYTVGEVGSIGDFDALDSQFMDIARKGKSENNADVMFNYAPPRIDQCGENELLSEHYIVPIEYPDCGTPGMGFIPWGPENKLPNFIHRTAYSLPYTARSLGYLRDAIVGLGCEFMYRFNQGSTHHTREVPYREAGPLILRRIAELRKSEEESQASWQGVLKQPGSVGYEIDMLQKDYEEWQRVNEEVRVFERDNDIHKHELSCITDFVAMEIYFPLIGLSRGASGEEWNPKIVSLRHVPCVTARMEQMDANRNVNYIYKSDKWRGHLGFGALIPQAAEIVAYPALPEVGTYKALKDVVKKAKRSGVKNRQCWFCIPRKIPSMNSLYYPTPLWWSIYSSAVYDYASTIIADRAAARMNATMWGKIIMINHVYLEHLYSVNGCDTAEAKMRMRAKIKQNIDDFLRNRKNNGATAMFESVVSPDGNNLWDSIKIIDVPVNNTVAAASQTELSEISNIIFMAMGIHSKLLGNEIKESSGGGTLHRELDLLKQKQVAPMQKDYLNLLNFIRDWNEWDVAHGVWRAKTMSLTTLDASKTGTTTVNNEGEKTE